MGMAGEAGEVAELDKDMHSKRVEEIGDCMWYVAVLSREIGSDLEDVFKKSEKLGPVPNQASNTTEAQLMIWAAKLVDVIKKTVFYGKTIGLGKIEEYLVKYVYALTSLAEGESKTLLEIGTLNIRKLAARYPDARFDAGKAIHRNHEAELKHF